MIKTSLKIILLLVLSYAAFVIAKVPADFVWHKANVPQQQAKLYDIAGTIYNGTAALLVTPQVTLNTLSWEWQPSTLLAADIGYRVQAHTENGKVSAIASVPLSQLLIGAVNDASATQVRGSVPLADLPLPPIARSVPLKADLLLNLDSLAITDQFPSEATGSIILGNINFTMGDEITSLGTIFADISTQESGEIVADLSSDGDFLDLAAEAKLQTDGRWSVEGSLVISDDLPPALFPIFGSAGKRQSDGSYLIAHNGQLPKPAMQTNPNPPQVSTQ
jgi:hypothetical protein